jgi:signal transduction histidine kinase
MPRGMVLSLDASSAPIVQGSAGLLGIAISNLLDNAIAHGRASGHVEVGLHTRDGHAEVVVDDDGPGIPDEQAARLGERFLRSAGSGSGLGLSIVHAIATLHGGALHISRSPLAGARVVLRLPLQAAPP